MTESNTKNLRVHGDILDRFIRESGHEILKELKNKYNEWALANDVATIKKNYVMYDEFFDEHLTDIRDAIGSERKFATFIGHRLEEFTYLLCKNICSSKRNLQVNKFSHRDIIAWIGFNSEGKLSVIGHGSDLAIGEWRKFTIKDSNSNGIEEKEFFVPNVIIECKNYVSLDMFRDIVMESEMFKRIYPYSLFIVVCEVMELTEEFQKIKKVWEPYIDGFFAFRPGKRNNPGKIIIDNVNAFEKFVSDFMKNL